MRSCLVLLALLATGYGSAQVATGKAKIDVGIRKPKHFLGENVLVDFCVVNIDTKAITIGVGGDYRGSSRSLRFKVEVRDAKGNLMPDPDPNPFNMGGLGYQPKIEPGKKWCQSLPLARYARITNPGAYTITATHDLAWPAGNAPTGKATITYAMPNAADAERVIAAMEKLPRDPNRSAGELSIDYADFSMLAYEPYVAPLLARAQKGSVDAITGLTFTPHVKATRALVTLIGHAQRDVARAATRGLAMRLPDPALAGQLGARNPFENAFSEQRKFLSQAWDPALADEVRAFARKRLASKEVDDLIDGAFILEALGMPADGPDLIKALDTAIDRTRTVPAETDIYPVPRGAMMELTRATRMLVLRGLVPVAAPKSLGEIAVLCIAIHAASGRNGARPANWEAELAKAMAHAVPYVRQLAMENAPDPVAPALLPALTANLAHADVDVQVAAASLAARGKLTQLAPNVVQAMRRATGLRLNIISNAAYSLGARWDRVQMLIVRLAEKPAFDEALSELIEILSHNGRSSDGEPTDAERAAVIPHWKKLVVAKRLEIEAGAKIPLTDPAVTPRLVPPQWKLGRPTGGHWP